MVKKHVDSADGVHKLLVELAGKKKIIENLNCHIKRRTAQVVELEGRVQDLEKIRAAAYYILCLACVKMRSSTYGTITLNKKGLIDEAGDAFKLHTNEDDENVYLILEPTDEEEGATAEHGLVPSSVGFPTNSRTEGDNV